MSALYPCLPWPVDVSCCPELPEDPGEWTSQQRLAVELATIELWRAVAGRIGLCEAFVRPCLDSCRFLPEVSGMYGGWTFPYIQNGSWFNRSPCGEGCGDGCSCSMSCTVTLPGPVHRIERVTVDGAEVPRAAWRLLTGDVLARVDRECWPTCQDLSVSDDRGFGVEYLRGIPPGPDAARALGLLACRKLRECPPDGNGDGCADLPSGVTALNREGMSMRFGDDRSDQGVRIGFGISAVDDFVSSVNPYGVAEYASVWSPDLPENYVWRQGPGAWPSRGEVM